MRVVAILIVLAGFLLTSGSGRAQSAPTEYEVKAAFMFNFAKFVQWPPEAFADGNSPLFIGVFGDNPFDAHLERAVRDKTVNNRPVMVKECRSVEDARKCHLVFINSAERRHFREILEGLGTASVLTVSETDNFIRSGGIINFFLEGKKIRFEINDEAARKAGLKIDSKLLGLAKKPPA